MKPVGYLHVSDKDEDRKDSGFSYADHRRPSKCQRALSDLKGCR